MLRLGVEVRPVDDPVDLPDPEDAVYLQTALGGQADILITGNRKHFPFEEYRGIRIVSPREFLMLTQEQGENE